MVLREPVSFVTVEELAKSTVDVRIYCRMNIFEYKGLALDLKKRIMNQIKEILMARGYSMPSDILEL